MQDHASRLVGLEGFAVSRIVEEGDQLDLEVELITRARRCPHCAAEALEVHERPVVAVRDLPIGRRSAVLRWRKRRLRCQACRRTHTESCAQVPARARRTARFRARLVERARSGGAHAEIAREERTTRYQVARALRVAAAAKIAARPGAPRRISFDEAAHRNGSHHLCTVISDLDRKRVHDVLDGRTRRIVERFPDTLTVAEYERVEVVCIDLHEPYRQAIRCKLPNAKIVVDPFHVVRGAGEALDTVRPRTPARTAPRSTRTRRTSPQLAAAHLPRPPPAAARRRTTPRTRPTAPLRALHR